MIEFIKLPKEDYGPNSFHEKAYDITIVKGLEEKHAQNNEEEESSK